MKVIHEVLPPLADSSWTLNSNQKPFNENFQDVYFSDQGGFEEALTVFLKPNRIPDRLKEKNHTVIGELGFGTGLNFLVTWYFWIRQQKPHRLTFISLESAPLVVSELKQSLSPFSELTSLKDQLISQYPDRVPGWHPVDFEEGRLRLLLGFGEARKLLSDLRTPIDAWYLDGFSPSKNPEMWSIEICQHVARLSHSQTTLGTYTSAGFVKKNLQAAGFNIEKTAGFGHKKNRLCGFFQKPAITTPQKIPSSATIVGAGLAGACLGYLLARKGLKVTILERQTIASGASGNPAGILKPALTQRPTAASLLALTAFGYARNFVKNLKGLPCESYDFSGTLQLINSPESLRYIQKSLANHPWPEVNARLLPPQETNEVCGLKIDQASLFFAQGGHYSPQILCEHLLKHDNIEVITDCEALSYHQQSDKTWIVKRSNKNDLATDALVVASSGQANDFFSWLPLELVKGQIIYLSDPVLNSLQCPISFGGFLIKNLHHVIAGASYEKNFENMEINENETHLILKKIQDQVIDFNFSSSCYPGRASLRAFSKDHLPIVGLIPDWEACQKTNLPHINNGSTLPRKNHLYVITALASRGLLWAPLLADLVASQITGDPLPIESKILANIDVGRFALRRLKRQQLP